MVVDIPAPAEKVALAGTSSTQVAQGTWVAGAPGAKPSGLAPRAPAASAVSHYTLEGGQSTVKMEPMSPVMPTILGITNVAEEQCEVAAFVRLNITGGLQD